MVLDAIERIEVALRSRMTNVLAARHGAHAYLDKKIFNTRYNYRWLLDSIRNECGRPRVELFIKHYRENYSKPELPPIWMVMEILTFSQVSIMFQNLRVKEDKQEICDTWGLPHTVLESWFRALAGLRNVCAHHSRTWNREFGVRPLIPKKKPLRWPDLSRPLTDQRVNTTSRLYYQLLVIEFLLRTINPGSSWHLRLRHLMNNYPHVSKAHMGMPVDWELDPFWNY